MEKNPAIPGQYQTVMLYLIIPDASGFLDFTRKVFGAVHTYTAMRDEHTIMHAEIMIGECTIMFADATDTYPPRPAGMFVYVNNADETFQKAIDSGAEVINPVEDHPYGRSGGVKDPFGNSWWMTSVPRTINS